eukprot:c23870_g2_i1.p2 GENE.c23870_g2_i1~~c23870_g2_i1.p2  ORF type:complete len:157 (-),score=10.60 c23870_g2_i1:279-749(-)
MRRQKDLSALMFSSWSSVMELVLLSATSLLLTSMVSCLLSSVSSFAAGYFAAGCVSSGDSSFRLSVSRPCSLAMLFCCGCWLMASLGRVHVSSLWVTSPLDRPRDCLHTDDLRTGVSGSMCPLMCFPHRWSRSLRRAVTHGVSRLGPVPRDQWLCP